MQKRKKKGIKLSKLVLLLILVVLISVMLTRVVFYSFLVEEIREVNVSVTVVAPTKQVGINLDTDALKFSTMPPGRMATKYLNISSEFPAKVIIKTEGEIGNWIETNRSFIIMPNQTVTIDVKLTVPQNAKLGDYKGKIVALFLKIY